MCFMWISEQTAIISLYIDWRVFITETCLLRGTDWICNSNLDWFSTLLLAVSGPPRAVEIRVAPRACPIGICDTHSGTGRCFLRARRFSPVNTIPPLLHTHLDLNTTLTRNTSGRNLEKYLYFRLCRAFGGCHSETENWSLMRMTRTDESVTSWYCTNCCSYTVWSQIILKINSIYNHHLDNNSCFSDPYQCGTWNIARPANLRRGKQVIYLIQGSLVCGLCVLPELWKGHDVWGNWSDVASRKGQNEVIWKTDHWASYSVQYIW